MKADKFTIQLVVPKAAARQTGDAGNPRAGSPQGLVGSASTLALQSVDFESFARQLSESVGKAAAAIEKSFQSSVLNYEAEEIVVSFAVTGEGNIGIATAGAEASLQVTFKRLVRSSGG